MDNIALDNISCVRWHPSGEFLASTSRDKTAQIIDLKTGKAIYTGVSEDGSTYNITFKFSFFLSMIF